MDPRDLGLNRSVSFDRDDLDLPASVDVLATDPGGLPFFARVSVELPFSSALWNEDAITQSGHQRQYFYAFLRFQADEEIKDMTGACDIFLDGDVAEIGVFELTIAFGQRYVELSFTGGDSLLRILLRVSPSIQQRFRELLQQAGGVAGLIFVEEDDFLLWTDRERTIRPDSQPYVDDDMDGFTAALLTKLNQLPEGDHGDQGIATTEHR